MLEAVGALNDARLRLGDKHVWSNEDFPIDVRVPRAFLFGCKKLLVGWKYKKSLVKVDTDTLTLKINGHLVISALVENSQLKVTYHGDFTNWQEFQTNSEVSVLKDKALDSLGRSGRSGDDGQKGAGKGAQQ